MTIEDLVTENERLHVENERLQAETATLKQRLAELETVVHDLKAQLEAAQRAGNPAQSRQGGSAGHAVLARCAQSEAEETGPEERASGRASSAT